MSDSDVSGDSDGDHVSNDEFAEAEHLAKRALERNKDDEEARRLWKLSRRGQGKSLGSDLPETLRREIYAEYTSVVDRGLYVGSDLAARLEQAENPHDLVSASIENATVEARTLIVSKYAITGFELDLILHEAEKEGWRMKPIYSANDAAAFSSWYYAKDDEKHVRQIVVKLAPETRSAPRACDVTADRAFTAPNWALTVLLDSQSGAPVVFAKATGAIELVDHQPADVVFAFYHLDHGGVFQIFVQIDSPEVRAKFGYPFVVEHARWLDERNDRRVIEAVIGSEKVELCFVAAGERDLFTTSFGLTGTLAPGCRERLQQEWDELRKHHDSVKSRDFQSALKQYNEQNPMEESPVLRENEVIKDAGTPPSEDQALSPEPRSALFQAATAVELDSASPTYLYSLAVARTQSAPQNVSDAELEKYYLDVCALFEKAVALDVNRSELDKEAYEKVAYTCGALYRSLKKHQDALRAFSVGLKHFPRNPTFLAGVGWSQFDLGKISEAEKTASQLLEVAPDSGDGRLLWKAIRKALGQELTSDLSEDLKRRIYKEYLQERDRSLVQGYMDSGVAPNLSFEQLVSDISGKAEDAELNVRRLLLEKYGLKEFEFELIVKQGEREAWDTA
jgi:tetratricopeptide (TPR) repeat protein